MAAGTTILHKRKAGAFVGGELAAGEFGVDTTNGAIYVSYNGTTVSSVGGGGHDAVTTDTAKTTTSGTTVDFTGVAAGVKRITVLLSGVSTNGTSNLILQLGDSGGFETTSYASAVSNIDGTNATSATTATAGFLLKTSVAAANTYTGRVTIENITGNTWMASSSVRANNGIATFQDGSKTLSDVLTQIRITTANGTDTFDAGTINTLYES